MEAPADLDDTDECIQHGPDRGLEKIHEYQIQPKSIFSDDSLSHSAQKQKKV